ncbi:glutathione synthase [Rickettsiales endosymbiont of Stachyamoeba lipophora]|uniref:glutathione synthase n=1 Tax=Rickettsiales endosymbiont of Stachyamoeba lipophora TaxID=2486578 RepID=UPI000F650D9B|nr:glutathione synthase [Rickettsiales endosymbiont of Stachyamoeba lipophora]AZL16057.1 glutathione synthase [Rickettsiales endosymbiont of Stachyamoeba lipophora]
MPKLFVQIDPLDQLNHETDTSLALIQVAMRDGFEIFTFQPDNLSFNCGKVIATVRETKILSPNNYWLGEKQEVNLELADILLIRQDPPYNMHYLTTCHLLKFISEKVVVVNPAEVLISNPEKIIPLHFQHLMPQTLISRDYEQLRSFLEKFGKVILKPLYGHAGRGVILVDAKSEEGLKAFKAYYHDTEEFIIAQQYLPQIRETGDIRVLMSYGEVLGAIARFPAPNQVVANLASGGEARQIVLNDKQLELCNEVGQFLTENNIVLAGLDIIGNYLTEVNITSPTGILVVNRLYSLNLEDKIWHNIKQIYLNKQKGKSNIN